MDDAHAQLKEEEARRIAAIKKLAIAEKKIKRLRHKVDEADRERKSAESALAGAEKQVEDQGL